MPQKKIILIILIIITIAVGISIYLIDRNTSEAPKVEESTEQNENPEPVEAEPEIRTDAKLLFFGDIALLEPLATMAENDPTFNPLHSVMEKFKEYDYVVGKLEATIDGASVGQPVAGKNHVFSTPKISVKLFKDAGIDAFSYAMNHARDYGPASVTHSLNLLREGGIDVFGAGNNQAEAFTPLIKEINGNKIAFLGFNSAEYAFNIATPTVAGTACFCENLVRESIAKAKAMADIVVVYSEAGTEHVTEPNALQIQWANIFTSAGADLVIGGHPHVRQRMEDVNGKKVIHSTGNFMFPGQAWNPEALKGWVVDVKIENKRIIDVKLLDIEMTAEGIPQWR